MNFIISTLLLATVLAVSYWIFLKDGGDFAGEQGEGLFNLTHSMKEELALRCIVLDPGHGSDGDPGCIYGGVYERELNLSMAVRVRDYLEGIGCRVILTRGDDIGLTQSERAEVANTINADAFVSIHHNALENDTVTDGIETWYNDESNSVNKKLAGYIQDETSEIAGAKNRGLRVSRKLIVTREATMPSCLVEVGFLSSDAERELLTDPAYQDKIAQGIVRGIIRFFVGS